MIGIGDTVPDATVWLDPRASVTVREIANEGPILLLFYLFDWSST
jgi:peroxiredoxin